MLEMLRAELHCHNVYSNGHVGDLEPPFDSNVTLNEQLENSLKSKLDILFVTNHNTLDGFKQITDYKHDHENGMKQKRQQMVFTYDTSRG